MTATAMMISCHPRVPARATHGDAEEIPADVRGLGRGVRVAWRVVAAGVRAPTRRAPLPGVVATGVMMDVTAFHGAGR